MAEASAPPARVVVIDDEDRVLRDLGRWLTSLGYQVRGFHDAGAALESLRRERADVVIAGGRVHDTNTVDLCASIRAAWRGRAPGIVGMVGVADASEAGGSFDAIVQRPCPRDALLTAIASVFPTAGR